MYEVVSIQSINLQLDRISEVQPESKSFQVLICWASPNQNFVENGV
ncbi:hypothetical protein SLEP1_g30112 [Rubroshorea leprosula]|uniref:Uncharacterized protein n=1 Tax=Rubroshorea leprosula TaxID=152421 RepID=A0AAV5JZ20_9ROSI|nr:hypothetical protein SLEP1_g30112 [Rubroshorea leprosula]